MKLFSLYNEHVHKKQQQEKDHRNSNFRKSIEEEKLIGQVENLYERKCDMDTEKQVSMLLLELVGKLLQSNSEQVDMMDNHYMNATLDKIFDKYDLC